VARQPVRRPPPRHRAGRARPARVVVAHAHETARPRWWGRAAREQKGDAVTDNRTSSVPRGDAGGVRLPAPTAHCYDHTVYDQFCHVCRECYRIQLEEEREQQQPATPAADHFADADNMIPAPWPGPAEYEPPPD